MQPNRTLIMTGKHPILHNGIRRPARCLQRWEGVKYWGKIEAKEILPVNDDGTYSLYNLQFEHDGFFVANGLVVDSVPSRSVHFPLPKELYYHPELYDNPVNIVNIPKLDKTILPSNKVKINKENTVLKNMCV